MTPENLYSRDECKLAAMTDTFGLGSGPLYPSVHQSLSAAVIFVTYVHPPKTSVPIHAHYVDDVLTLDYPLDSPCTSFSHIAASSTIPSSWRFLRVFFALRVGAWPWFIRVTSSRLLGRAITIYVLGIVHGGENEDMEDEDNKVETSEREKSARRTL